MTYDEALAVRKKWAHGAQAELLGFQAAQFEHTMRVISTDPYTQQRYEQGFTDGMAIVQADEQEAS